MHQTFRMEIVARDRGAAQELDRVTSRLGSIETAWYAAHRIRCVLPMLTSPHPEDIATVEGIPDPEPSTLFLVDHHVFSNCDRPDVFTYNDEVDDGNGNVIIGCLVGK